MALTVDFEDGTLSSTILTGNPRSANALGSIQIGATGAAIYDNTHVYCILSSLRRTPGSYAMPRHQVPTRP
jgi:hypothetical protein